MSSNGTGSRTLAFIGDMLGCSRAYMLSMCRSNTIWSQARCACSLLIAASCWLAVSMFRTLFCRQHLLPTVGQQTCNASVHNPCLPCRCIRECRKARVCCANAPIDRYVRRGDLTTALEVYLRVPTRDGPAVHSAQPVWQSVPERGFRLWLDAGAWQSQQRNIHADPPDHADGSLSRQHRRCGA